MNRADHGDLETTFGLNYEGDYDRRSCLNEPSCLAHRIAGLGGSFSETLESTI